MIKEQFINKMTCFNWILVPIEEETSVTVPNGADAIRIDFIDATDNVAITFLYDVKSEIENRSFVVVGNHIEFIYHHNWDYLGNCYSKKHSRVYHIFEVK